LLGERLNDYLKYMKKKKVSREEVTVTSNDNGGRGGLCCPHCADSKYPCVTMERLMRKAEEAAAKKKEEEEE
jgi:hypothetical protein